jgi:DNA gyrase subunit B
MPYDASKIEVLHAFEAVRRRPGMYFGAAREDPALPARVLALVVQDALVEEAPDGPLTVRVVVDGPYSFSVEDDGPGLPVEPMRPGLRPAITEMMTSLMCGQSPMRRWGMGMVTALCTQVVADVWQDGRHYRQRAGWQDLDTPLEVVGDSSRHGTRVAYRLDDAYLAPAELPSDLLPLLEPLFSLPHHDEEVPRPLPGTTIELIDRRGAERTASLRSR